MLPRTSVNVPWGCINTLLYWIVPLFVSHRNPIRLTRVISSDVSQTEHENKMVTLPCLSPGPPSMRSDALHEHFMIRFKLIWIWMFPCELSSFTKLETISIIANFSSHVIFFLIHEDLNRSSHNFALYLQALQCAPQEQQVQQKYISACHTICSEILSCESWCAAFSLCMPVQCHKASCSYKGTGKDRGRKDKCVLQYRRPENSAEGR